MSFKVAIEGWEDGKAIPARFSFGKIPAEGRFELGGNTSPAISWTGAPEGTKSYALICHDPDVPSSAEDVNKEGRTVPASLPRINFYHWVLWNIPASTTSIAEGAASSGVTPRGKPPGKKPYGQAGVNSYTNWFEGDKDMEGTYADYDGPCPPWNDSIVHHYHFTVYALSEDNITLPDNTSGADLEKAIEGKTLGKASYMGTYTMNRDL